jgi:Ca2+-binding EF-hand superfamily protein
MKWTTLAALAALGLAATATAQPGNDRTNQVTFAEADKDGDGRVNREEGNAINGFDFSRADTDNNGTLTAQEFTSAMARSTARGDGNEPGDRTEQVAFDQADKNRDGKVDRDEAADIDGFNFTAADANDDKWLSREEFRTAMAGSTPRG